MIPLRHEYRKRNRLSASWIIIAMYFSRSLIRSFDNVIRSLNAFYTLCRHTFYALDARFNSILIGIGNLRVRFFHRFFVRYSVSYAFDIVYIVEVMQTIGHYFLS